MLVAALQKNKTVGFSSIKVDIRFNNKTERFSVIMFKIHPIYPSTLKLEELYGYEELGKWVHGVLYRTLKDIQSDHSTASHWVYFDGAVDESWVSILKRASSVTNKNFAGDNELSLSNQKVI